MSWRNMNSNKKKEEYIWNAGHHSKSASSEKKKKNEKPWETGRRDQEKGERKGGVRGSGEGRASGCL